MTFPETLTLAAPPHTDLFIDPAGADPVLNAPRSLKPMPDNDFQLSARVTVDFGQTYDAGVLLVWADDRNWAKLCFERSPQGDPMAVSVVTRGVSDDANAFTVNGNTLWLRVSHLGPAFAFHAAIDGELWEFVRYFALDTFAGLQLGFEAQSPLGDGCTAAFDEIRYTPQRLTGLRDGS
jgi:regulation of enolase protein 1 (concanavalin A-like superfamily)